MTMSALGEPCVLLKLGEIVLKGKNREVFERRLISNIRQALKDRCSMGEVCGAMADVFGRYPPTF